jgi:uncharacterized protein YoxC
MFTLLVYVVFVIAFLVLGAVVYKNRKKLEAKLEATEARLAEIKAELAKLATRV